MKSLIRFLLFLFIVLVVLAGALFSFNNTATIPLWIGTELKPQPVSLWVIAAFVAGGLLGLAFGFGFWNKFRLTMQLKSMESKLQRNNAELADLKQQLKQAHKDRPS